MRYEKNYLSNNGRMSTSAGSAVGGSTSHYTPFGDWRTEPTANLTDRGYTGHLHNNLGSGSDDLGLIYMNARYYLPSSGRFISPDTIVPNTGNPQSFNRYSYTYNNPVNYIDPSGHIACDHANLPGMDQAACSNPDFVYPNHQATQTAINKAQMTASDKLVQINTIFNDVILWPTTAIGAGTYQVHNSWHNLVTVAKPAAQVANKVGVGLSIFSGTVTQLQIMERYKIGELTPSETWKQTATNALFTGGTTYLGAGVIAKGASALSGMTVAGIPVIGSAGPVALTVGGVTSLAYVGPIAQGTVNNMIEGQPFTTAFFSARAAFHDLVLPIPGGGNAWVDKQVERFFGPPLQAIGDGIIWLLK